MSKKLTHDDKLEEALALLAAGIPVKEILAETGSDAEWLHPMLETASEIGKLGQAISIPLPNASLQQFLDRGKELAAGSQPTVTVSQPAGWQTVFSNLFKNNWTFRLAGLAVALLVVILLGGALNVMAQSSLPGQRLYRVKRIGEAIHLSLTRDPEQRKWLISNFNDRRKLETELLLKQGLQATIGFEGRVESLTATTVTIDGLTAQISAETVITGKLAVKAGVYLEGATQPSGQLIAVAVTVIEAAPVTITPTPIKTDTPAPTRTATKSSSLTEPELTPTPVPTKELFDDSDVKGDNADAIDNSGDGDGAGNSDDGKDDSNSSDNNNDNNNNGSGDGNTDAPNDNTGDGGDGNDNNGDDGSGSDGSDGGDDGSEDDNSDGGDDDSLDGDGSDGGDDDSLDSDSSDGDGSDGSEDDSSDGDGSDGDDSDDSSDNDDFDGNDDGDSNNDNSGSDGSNSDDDNSDDVSSSSDGSDSNDDNSDDDASSSDNSGSGGDDDDD